MASEREIRAPVQGEGDWYFGKGPPNLKPTDKPPGTIAWSEHEEAWRGYAKRYSGQTAKRIAERGGFYYGELIEFLGREPTTWKANNA